MTETLALLRRDLDPDASLDPNASWEANVGGGSVVFGSGTLSRLGEEVARLGIRRPLLVTDPGIVAAGHVEHAVEALSGAGMAIEVWSDVRENPDTELVARATEAARRHDPDGIVAVGGGSSMDCAKGVNFLLTNGGTMRDYWGDGKAQRPMLPSLAVPTTAGTGSEGQRFALISDSETHRKMACGDHKARFRTVILDPDLIESVPRPVAAVTGMDAVSHAVESFVTRRRNPISHLFAREAWRLLDRSFETYLERPASRSARSGMLLGAHFAGSAIEASMLGAAHSSANPLTARYGLVHGRAVGLMLPHVVRFNGVLVEELYRDLVQVAGLNGGPPSREQPASCRLSGRLTELLQRAGMPVRLADCEVPEADLRELAGLASQEWTARFNPRRIVEQDFVKLYEAAY